MQAKGFKTILMGPAGPLAPGGQTIKHRPWRIHVSHGEVSLGARRT